MYCSSCGVVVTQGLSYCNYCGAKLNSVSGEKVLKSSEVKPEILVSSMVVLFVFGLIAITMLMGVMKAVIHLEAGQILGFATLCFLIMLSIEGVLVSLLMRRKRGAHESSENVVSKGQATNELNAAQARGLPEPVPSVTEHTTRAFEQVYNKRTSE